MNAIVQHILRFGVGAGPQAVALVIELGGKGVVDAVEVSDVSLVYPLHLPVARAFGDKEIALVGFQFLPADGHLAVERARKVEAVIVAKYNIVGYIV